LLKSRYVAVQQATEAKMLWVVRWKNFQSRNIACSSLLAILSLTESDICSILVDEVFYVAYE